MKLATLVFVRDGDKILLGLKKKGFGAGKLNGFGGKVEPGESVEDAAVREVLEESGVLVDVGDLKSVGKICFKYPSSDWLVHVFVAEKFSGLPVETSEMVPEWFDVSLLPLNKMWADDEFWLPSVLLGKNVDATFVFSGKEEIVDSSVRLF